VSNRDINSTILFDIGQVLCDKLKVSPDRIGKVTDFEDLNYAKLTKLHFMDNLC
jgi:hypothetical protein